MVGQLFPGLRERADGVNVWDVDGIVSWILTSAFGVTGLGDGAGPIAWR